jgi:Na+-translocating ferredoxin:NAD+ oxidoreductase RnfD subunit
MSTGSTSPTAASSPPPRQGPKPGKLFGVVDNRFLAPILITCILVVGDWKYRFLEGYPLHGSVIDAIAPVGSWQRDFLESYSKTGLAILSAILLELVLGRFATGRWPHLASAYISGISVGILVRSPYFWPFVVCSLLSISSKYAIRVKGRHLWNPSNLGVSVLLLLAPQALTALGQHWGNDPGPLIVIWCLGCMILYRFGLFHITLTYVTTFMVLALVRSVYNHESWLAEIIPLTAPIHQLFIFFMITDPKTITRTKPRQCLVAFLVAVVDAVIRMNEASLPNALRGYAPLYALFIVGPTANLIEIWWTARRALPRGSSVPAAPPVKTDAPAQDTPAVVSPTAP